MRVRILTALLALLVLSGLVPPPVAVAASLQLTGPDVASYQHPKTSEHPKGAPIDWAAVRRSGQSFAFVKATESAGQMKGYTNPFFASDWRGVAAAGMYRGAYHYARPGDSSAPVQGAYFANAIGPQRVPGMLPPILDLEDAGGLSVAALQNWVQGFLNEVQARTGRLPMIYSYPSFWQNQMGGTRAFVRYPLWIANYKVSSPQLIGWPRYTFWQYTSEGAVDGIDGNVDRNVFNGTALDLAALAMTGTWGAPSSTAADTSPPPTPPAPSRYVAVPPQRVADTRAGQGPVQGDLTVTLPASVPADSTGVVLDVSAVAPTGPGWVRLAPTGSTPTTTALNYGAGRSTTSLAVTRSNAQRQVTVSTYGTAVNLAVDLVGYYTATAGTGGFWKPLTPARVADTRNGPQVTGDVVVTLPSSVPATAAGVVLDVTASDPTGPGFVRVAPAGSTPVTTALNYDGSAGTTGLAITRAEGSKVTVKVFGAATHLVVDLVGYYEGTASSGSGYVAVTPQRFLDTRAGLGANGPGTGPLSLTVPSSVPNDAVAVILDVSVVSPNSDGYIRMAAPGTEATTTAVNMSPGQDATGLVITGIRDGQITLAAYGATTDLVIDIVGYQAAP